MRSFLVMAALSILLTACNTLKAPEPVSDQTQAAHHWWTALNDPLLNELATQVTAQNIDVKLAEARLLEARALRRVDVTGLLPSVDGTASARRGNNIAFGRTSNVLDAGFDASWEIDVFGKQRAAIARRNADIRAAEANQDDVKNTVIADLARAVVEWRQAQEQYRVTENLLKTQADQIEIFGAREKAGLSDATLTSRAKAQRDQSAVQLPLFDAAAKRAQYQMENLLGLEPDALRERLAQEKASVIDPPKADRIVAQPASVIEQRPDVRQAAAALEGARADIREAKASMWPRLTLGAFFGVQKVSPDNGFVADNPLWNVGAGLTAPLLYFGKLRAAVDVANAREKTAILSYEKVTLNALQETQTALNDYLTGLNAVEKQAAALRSRADTVEIAQERFTRGITNMTDLTTAQGERETAALNLVNQKAAATIAYIRLQKSLGLVASE